MKRKRIDDERDDREEQDEREEGDEDEDRPRKKKKKKKLKETEKNYKPYFIIAGCVGGGMTLLLIIAVVVIVLVKGGKNRLEPVTAYQNLDSPEEVFHLDVPQGWESETGGKKTMTSARVKKGSATIHVNESIVGSLMGDIAGAAQPDLNAPDEMQPFAKVHEFKKKMFEDEYSKYEEEPAITVRNGFGKSRRSTFTCIQGITRMKGYRSTSMGVMTQITVTCLCAQKDWDICEPAFARAIETLAYGNGRK